MRTPMTAMTLFVICVSNGCSAAGPSPLPLPPQPVPSDGINGDYTGDLVFTEENTSYGWPAHLTVTASLRQDGADVGGVFNLLEVDYSGGFVKGIVDTAVGGDAPNTFRADFWPDDLGDHFAIDTKIVSPDGGEFAGTFVFADGLVGHGDATFTRRKR